MTWPTAVLDWRKLPSKYRNYSNPEYLTRLKYYSEKVYNPLLIFVDKLGD